MSVTKIVTQFRFIFDISDKLRGGAQEETLTVKVRDPTDTKVTPDNCLMEVSFSTVSGHPSWQAMVRG